MDRNVERRRAPPWVCALPHKLGVYARDLRTRPGRLRGVIRAKRRGAQVILVFSQPCNEGRNGRTVGTAVALTRIESDEPTSNDYLR